MCFLLFDSRSILVSRQDKNGKSKQKRKTKIMDQEDPPPSSVQFIENASCLLYSIFIALDIAFVCDTTCSGSKT